MIHPTEKLLDYSLPDENDKLYLLKNCIRLKNNAQDRLRAYEFCDEYNLDVNVFLSTFTYSKMEIHKFSWGGEFSHLLINDIEYKLPKIKELMALYLEYKDMKWINTENNKYVEYPTYTKLTTFLDLLNNQKKYKKYKMSSKQNYLYYGFYMGVPNIVKEIQTKVFINNITGNKTSHKYNPKNGLKNLVKEVQTTQQISPQISDFSVIFIISIIFIKMIL